MFAELHPGGVAASAGRRGPEPIVVTLREPVRVRDAFRKIVEAVYDGRTVGVNAVRGSSGVFAFRVLPLPEGAYVITPNANTTGRRASVEVAAQTGLDHVAELVDPPFEMNWR